MTGTPITTGWNANASARYAMIPLDLAQRRLNQRFAEVAMVVGLEWLANDLSHCGK